MDGKFFRAGGRRFRFHGVTYGTFRARPDGALFPGRDQVKRDFETMNLQGVTVVRTYTPPPDDVVEVAADYGLRLLAGVFYPDWRYLLGTGGREASRIGREAVALVKAEARRLAGEPTVLGLSVGNEIPADALRWYGTRRVGRAVGRLAQAVHDVDPQLLVTYANYPTAEYLQLPDLDFVTFNVFLERQQDFRRYLTRLHHLAGDRPLVLGEMGLHAGGPGPDGVDPGQPGPGQPGPGQPSPGEAAQAELLEWQFATAVERGVAGTCVFSWTDEWNVGGNDVEGWRFGLTRADRSARPALEVFHRWSSQTVTDLKDDWPKLSVVVCAYNAAATLDECLTHLCALDYPGLDIVVVDDGSTDATAETAGRHPRARLLSIEHAGLSAARNAGCSAATGEIVAYLDADAFPTPEWPYYLALAFDGAFVAAAGGPNLPPTADGLGAQVVARAPGGPVHVLFTDDRAEHVPGCNMAFWKETLEEIGGFDSAYTAAGDDVDICWKVLDAGWEIGFHPAALVWHHRRPGLRPYIRQQVGYGRAEALVERRHPDRFTAIGSARWRGRIYNSLVPSAARPRIYRGLYGAAAYQSIYGGGGHGLDIAHQMGMPLAVLAVLLAPLGLIGWWGLAPAACGLAWIVALGAVDFALVRIPTEVPAPGARFRALVAACHLLQPLARSFARMREQVLGWRDGLAGPALPPARAVGRGVFVYPDAHGRPALVSSIVAAFRADRTRVLVPSGWEGFDARLAVGVLVAGELLSSAYPEGCVQVRVRIRGRLRRGLVAGVLLALAWLAAPVAGAVLSLLVAVDVGRGVLRCTVGARRVLEGRGPGRRASEGPGW